MDRGSLPRTGVEFPHGLSEWEEEQPARPNRIVVARDVEDEVASRVAVEVEGAVAPRPTVKAFGATVPGAKLRLLVGGKVPPPGKRVANPAGALAVLSTVALPASAFALLGTVMPLR